MILAVDVGNSRVHLGRFDGNHLAARADVPAHGSGDLLGPADRDRLLPGIDRVLVASVNPPVAAWTAEWFRLEGLQVDELRGARIPLANRTREPERVGIDRLLNAFGARRIAGGACVVVSLGSAITVDAVTAAGEFLGGAILPGVTTALWALHERCARLPLEAPAPPPAAIGRTTREAILSGVVLGTAGSIRLLAARMREEAGEEFRGFLTGGDARLVAPFLPEFGEPVPDLTLQAIRWIAGP